MEEIWYDIKGCEGMYQYSNKFRFRRLHRTINWNYGTTREIKEKILVPRLTTSGYPCVSLAINYKYKQIYVHKFFAEIYIPNPENKPLVNHRNGNKLDYSLNNLEWATDSEDREHAHRTGLIKPKKGEKSPMFRGSKVTRAKTILNLQTGIFYNSLVEAAESERLKYKQLSKMMIGNRKNRTSFVYV